MANLFHDEDDGTLMAEIAGMAIPFDYLSGYGVTEVVRVCMGLEPLCSFEARGSKGKNMAEGEALAKNAKKLLTEEGLEWAKEHRLAKAPKNAKLLIPEVGPDQSEDELAALMAEQEADMQEATL